MGDWTTRVLSNEVQIDLHPDLNSFPTCIRTNDQQQTIMLSKEETYELFKVLLDYYGGTYSTG